MKKVLVCSGKGGVGKTTIALCISKMLSKNGYKVGLLDVDIENPNIPEFMEIEERDLELSDSGIIPKNKYGIQVMSVGFMADTNIAIIWDGKRRSMALDQMINHVDWSCDVLIIDAPAGTADETTEIVEKFNPDGIILVTSSHKASISDIKRTIAMIKLLKSEKKIIGIIKNMDFMICPECKAEINLFGNNNNHDNKDIDDMVIADIPFLENTDKLCECFDDVVGKIEEVL